jgi:hypothetical protein
VIAVIAVIAIGEEFLYCVKAAGSAAGGAAFGRACGLRPVPPSASPTRQKPCIWTRTNHSSKIHILGDVPWIARETEAPSVAGDTATRQSHHALPRSVRRTASLWPGSDPNL